MNKITSDHGRECEQNEAREHNHKLSTWQCTQLEFGQHRGRRYPRLGKIVRNRLDDVYKGRRPFTGPASRNLHVQQRRVSSARDVIRDALRGGIENFSPDMFRVKYGTRLLDM